MVIVRLFEFRAERPVRAAVVGNHFTLTSQEPDQGLQSILGLLMPLERSDRRLDALDVRIDDRVTSASLVLK